MSKKGSEWAKEVRDLPYAQVMASALEQIQQGNNIRWPQVEITVGDITLSVCSDVFAIGCDDDLVRVPLDGPTAQSAADILGCYLPTSKISDLIWRNAAVKLPPAPMQPPQFPYDSSMRAVERFHLHSQWIDKQLTSLKGKHGDLVAGQKKDVVISNRLLEHPGRLAIYGWHRSDGSPIQGPNVSIAHVDHYYDYSHGIRLINNQARLKGSKIPLQLLLQNETQSKHLSCEGTIDIIGYDEDPSTITHLPPTLSRRRKINSEPAVKHWQSIVKAEVDGVFGPLTERATRIWQSAHGLVADGVVGPLTWRMALGVDKPSLPPEPTGIKLVQARNYRPIAGKPRDIDYVVIHTMEAAEHPQTAENVAAWFAGPHAPRASSHFNVDEDSIVQSVLEKDVAFCAPGTNHNGIHLEHAGYARQTSEQWQDAYSLAMLARSARLAADIAQRYSIPVTFVDWKGLLKGERGITYHKEVSKACRHAQAAGLKDSPFYNHYENIPKTNHGDPGRCFPIKQYLSMIESRMADRSE